CIDFYIEHSVDSDLINIGFYGGEPLIEFELIKKCILYVESISEGKNLMFTMTTNGTLLKEEIVRFLEEHGVVIRISLDGPKEVHDRSRKFAFNNFGSFDKIIENVNMIKDKFPEYYKRLAFSTVLDQKNDLSCISQFFTDFETVKDVSLFAAEIVDNYAKNSVDATEDFRCKIGYEHFKVLLSKVTSFNEKYISKIVAYDYENLGRMYKHLQATEALPEKTHPGGPCIPGIQRLFVNVDGDMFPCERVNESSEATKIGNINEGFDLGKIRALLNIGRLSGDKCKNCWAFRFCTLCCTSADTGDGLSGDKKISRCRSVRDTAEYDLKDICTLKENNFDFDFSNWFIIA
ncbi:MAG: Radical domain protein, partial [Eubacterium sp.]|nr:Radical domain protein [Eubacterium sp.]